MSGTTYTIELTGPVTGREYTVPTVAFDGRRFPANCAHTVPFLYLAFKARRGDALAAELLDAFGVSVRDAGDRPYWPTGGGG
jgi:hypothetical protein